MQYKFPAFTSSLRHFDNAFYMTLSKATFFDARVQEDID